MVFGLARSLPCRPPEGGPPVQGEPRSECCCRPAAAAQLRTTMTRRNNDKIGPPCTGYRCPPRTCVNHLNMENPLGIQAIQRATLAPAIENQKGPKSVEEQLLNKDLENMGMQTKPEESEVLWTGVMRAAQKL